MIGDLPAAVVLALVIVEAYEAEHEGVDLLTAEARAVVVGADEGLREEISGRIGRRP